MIWERRNWGLVRFCLLWTLIFGLLVMELAQVATTVAAATTGLPVTTVADTVYRADGAPASGTVLISWPAFTTAGGSSVPAGSTSVTLGAGGALNVSLTPNAGSNPMGTYYTVVYHLSDGSTTREYWVVPATVPGGATSVKLNTIRNAVLPASVAMQTVTKNYVDQAVARAVTGTPEDSSPYVEKSGDTMTGPLVLPGDPVSALQASDKNYVDEQTAALQAGLGQKVSLLPQATQAVAQPAGTQLQVNNLNGSLYASQYQTGAGGNGIANAAASPDCANGCDIHAEHTYQQGTALNAQEQPQPTTWNNQTTLVDHRNGELQENFFNPLNAGAGNTGHTITVTSTQSAPAVLAATGSAEQFSTGLTILQQALTGGSNEYPNLIEGTVPYFKTSFSAMQMTSNNNTPGQHVQDSHFQNCYGVGDCLMGGFFMQTSGGFRDDADEGAHPFDQEYAEDARVFTGSCGTGCTAGSTTVQVNGINNQGTQGEGRYLLDAAPAQAITTGLIVGGVASGGILPVANFSGTSFPVSVFLETAATVPTQSNNIAPGTVTVPVVTSGAPTGFATNTAALPSATGVACVVDQQVADGRPLYFETANYTVVDGSDLQLTLRRPHANGAVIAVGGLCGYGLEQKVDTIAGIRQVFPVVGSTSTTQLYYAGGQTSIVGTQGLQSAFANINLVIASLTRSGGMVTVTTATPQPDWTGLAVTIAGVSDASYNGTFTVTTTGSFTFTYAQAGGANSSATGGTASYNNGSFGLYPMAEVTGVFNATTKAVDGQLQLAPNRVNWAAGDPVEEPHYFQSSLNADTQIFTAYEPRPSHAGGGGITYNGNNGPGLDGWVINNGSPASNYFSNGGTHGTPFSAMVVAGIWRDALEMQAGENSAIHVHCNSKGCDRWNSAYDLFQMDTSVGVDQMQYDPATSDLNFYLRGQGYNFTPQAFTANTINVTTLNAGTINGAFNGQFSGDFSGSVTAASLPVFGASGPQHASGAVPDPGPVAGTTRFLREDGTFAAPPGAASTATGNAVVSSASIYAANGQVQADASTGSTIFGGVCLGDSLMFGAGASVPANGMCALIGSDLNIVPMKDVAIPGDTAGDLAWQSLTYLNPADNGNPSVVAMIGPNDTPNGTGGLPTFNQNEYAAYAWAALPGRNKVSAANAAVTQGGSWSAYTNFANLPGLTAGSAGSTLTYTAQVGPSGVLYLWFGMSSGASTLSVAIDGAAAVDTVTGGARVGTSLSYAPASHSYSAGLARFVASPGSHTVTVTAQSGVTVLGFGVPPTTRLRGSSAPRIVFGGVSQLPNFTVANTQLYNAASVAVSKQLVADGLNVPFADVQNGTIDFAADFSGTATPSCPATSATGHPNDCGQRHYAGLFEAQLNTAPTLFAGTGGLTSPITAAGPFNFNYGAVPASTNQFTSFGPKSYTNSLEAGVQLCPQDAQELCGLKPHFFSSVGYGMALYETTQSSPLGFCWGQNGNPTADAQYNCPVFMTSDGTVHATSLSVTSPVTVAGYAPQCALGPGAGTNPQCSITGNPQQFLVSVTADAAATASGKILTAYFAQPLAQAYHACMVSPQALTDTNPVISPAYAGVPTTSYVTLTAGTTALTAGTTYHWALSCF